MNITICKSKKVCPIIIEKQAFPGVKRIANRLSEDIKLACNRKPEVYECDADGIYDIKTGEPVCVKTENAIFVATEGNSVILEKLISEKKYDVSKISGKRECYKIGTLSSKKFALKGLEKTSNILMVTGSDKRGTIYGMFDISERVGVTSFVYWGDLLPKPKDELIIDIKSSFTSKEPSIEYRGLFINDEWPAFGNWCNEQFGGFNAKCYEEVFIFILRMKGNFLWPAMWSAIFSEDGPGIENARLADELGVVMGTSHHEPLFRAGEEWQHMYKQYGDSNAWNFLGNQEAITNFWIDGVKRNKDFESLVTIGMRGEADSKLLPENATMQDNIDVVMAAIRTQNQILKDYMNEDLTKINRVLAIYKEVEDYYYGDENTVGLKDYEELEDVMFLLSDDNWGNTRGLPTEAERNHRGGYGMYYHFDYHGGPISYEWQNSSRLKKINEQLMMAYEYGVKKLWVVNVGDIKGYEYPLTYFMDLAYDIEKWGEPNKVPTYVNYFVDKYFTGYFDAEGKKNIIKALELYTRMNSFRKPESLNEDVYEPVNYNEAERIIEMAEEVISLWSNEWMKIHTDKVLVQGMESIFGFQLILTMNIHALQAEAAINKHLAGNLSLMANEYAKRVENRIAEIERGIGIYNKQFGGKWNHMLDSGFTGYRDWCDKDWGYPVLHYVTPINKGKIIISFRGDKRYHLGQHWQDGEPICNEEFTRPETKKISIYLDSRGKVPFCFEVKTDKKWLKIGKHICYQVPDKCPRSVIDLTVDRNKLSGEEIAYVDFSIKFENGESTTSRLAVKANNCKQKKSTRYMENQGHVCINAEHFAEKIDTAEGEYKVIRGLGRLGSAVKGYPVTKDFSDSYEKPCLRYDFVTENEGTYVLEADVLQRNPVVKGTPMNFGLKVNEGEFTVVNTVDENYYTYESSAQWANGVLDNVRRIETEIQVKKGENHMYIYAMSPNVMFDKFVIYDKTKGLKKSYLGPMESYTV